MLRFLSRLGNWFGRVLLPVRLRPTVLQYRITAAIERSVEGLERGGLHAGKTVERVEAGEHPKPSALATFARWALHFLLVFAILVGLYYLNEALHLEQVLRSPFPALHHYWLPLLFLLLYLMAWLGWWLWELTGPDKRAGDFPEINTAWAEAMHAMATVGVDVREVPLFLVLGRPQSAEEAVFDAAGLPWRPIPPRHVNAPLYIYVTGESVFVTCTEASLFGRLTTLLAEEAQERPGAAGDVQVKPPAVAEANGTAAAEQPEGGAAVLAAVGAPQISVGEIAEAGATEAESAGAAPLTEEQQRVIGLLEAEQKAEQPRALDKRRALLRDEVAVELLTGRLRHLCRLIARDRRPYCPINGVLVLAPFTAFEDDNEASQAATACAQDLATVHDELQVKCPAFVLVCDLDQSPGFSEFLTRLPPGQQDRRLGQRFPLVPDVEETAIPQMVQDGVGWLSQAVLPALVYNLFRTEAAANGADAKPQAALLEGNIHLFQMLAQVRERRRRLARFLTRGLLLDGPGSFLLGGVYLGGTGKEGQQAFVSGVFQRLIENQNNVAWTAEALAAERRYHRLAQVGWLLTLLLVVGGLGLTYALWFMW